jgi:hypothetical protein
MIHNEQYYMDILYRRTTLPTEDMTNHRMDMNMNMNDDAGAADADDDNYYNDNMDFCKGMFMTMSMKGFQSALFSNNNNKSDCLTFLFTNWKLDSSGKFLGAMSKL